MAVKRTIHECCQRCGNVQAVKYGEWIKWDPCNCAGVPGPQCPPKRFHEREVIFQPSESAGQIQDAVSKPLFHMDLRALCNMAARDLPEGWEIAIRLQKDSGVVELEDPFGDDVEFPTNHESIEQQVRDAIEYAQAEDVHLIRGPLPGELRDARWTTQSGQ